MLYLWLDNVRKPQNLGAVLRLAAALGATLVSSGATPAHLPPRARFAAVGLEHTVPREHYPSFDDALAALRLRHVTVVGTAPRAPLTLWQADALAADPLAIVFGSETGGLGAHKLARLDATLAIPMPGGAESLNLATSVAIVAWEALRRRST